MRRVSELMTTRARALRRDATPAERLLWRHLSRYRPRFTRQLVVGPFVLDLACREAKLAVEVDGSQHVDEVKQDQRRTALLEERGWTVLRYWNAEVLTNPIGCTEPSLRRAADRLGGTHPQPLPYREGRMRMGSD